jgi:hypothetical protein
MGINVADEQKVVEEWCSMQTIAEMIHEVPCPAFYESVVIVEDVTSPIIKHACAATKCGEAGEVVQRGRCMWWLQVPTEAASVRRVVEEV